MSLLKIANLTPKPPGNTVQQARLLLIDSEPHSRKVLRLMLEPHFQVLTADCAEHTLDLLENNDNRKIQVILCEQELNDIDGLTLLSQMLPIIPNAIALLFGSHPAQQPTVHRPANLYRQLYKPIWPTQLISTIKDAVSIYHRRIELLEQSERLNTEIQEVSEQLSNKKLQMDEIQQSLACLYHH